MAQRAAAWENMRQRVSSGWRAQSMGCAVVGIRNMTPLRLGPCVRKISLKSGSQRRFRPLGNEKRHGGLRIGAQGHEPAKIDETRRNWRGTVKNSPKTAENHEIYRQREMGMKSERVGSSVSSVVKIPGFWDLRAENGRKTA